jgi:hypothetical protein
MTFEFVSTLPVLGGALFGAAIAGDGALERREFE